MQFKRHLTPLLSIVTYSLIGFTYATAQADDVSCRRNYLEYEVSSAISVLPASGTDQFSRFTIGAFTTSGLKSAEGLSNGSVAFSDLESGQRRIVDGHARTVNAIVLSQDGSLAFTGSIDGSIRMWSTRGRRSLGLWNSRSSQVIRQLGDGSQGITALAILPNNRLVSGSSDGQVVIWNVTGGERAQTIIDGGASVNSISLSPDRSKILVGTSDGFSLLKWNNYGQLEVERVELRSTAIVSLHPNTNIVAAGLTNGSVVLWDLQKVERIASLTGHSTNITVQSFFNNGEMLVTGSSDGMIIVWETATQRQLARFQTNSGYPTAVHMTSIDAQTHSLAVSSSTGRLMQFRLTPPVTTP